jgi:hypothetical protein
VGPRGVSRGRFFLLVGSDALVAEGTVSPRITHDTPLRSILIPTRRSMTQRPERNHCPQMGVPMSRNEKGRPYPRLRRVLDQEYSRYKISSARQEVKEKTVPIPTAPPRLHVLDHHPRQAVRVCSLPPRQAQVEDRLF